MDVKASLFALSRAVGPSGVETPAVEAARALLAPLVDETQIDAMGSLIGLRRCGRPDARRVLLDAHLDEVSMVVTGQTEGYLRFAGLGIDARLLPAHHACRCSPSRPCTGSSPACRPTCSPPPSGRSPSTRRSSYIDCGLTEEQAKAVPAGHPRGL